MKKLAVLLVLSGLSALPALAAAATFNNVSVIDVNCSRKEKEAAHPDAHTRACALRCERSGFGIYTADHQFLKFDAAGNKAIVQELKNSQEKDHLRVDVSGEVQGSTLNVSSVKLR